ncbi:FecR family protein [Pseudomonadota bacterium AL_CKDN230030165-1A_HGKHYDSX7]
MSAVPASSDPLEHAIDWMVLLESGEASPADRARFSAWLADPSHAQAWQTVRGAVSGALAPVRGPQAGAASAALRQPVSRRKWMLGAGLLLAGGGSAAWVLDRHTPLMTLASDLRTGTAERRRYPLPDGSVITLNARSAADLAFDDSERRVWLRAGALCADVAADARPFVVATAHCEVHAQQGEFAVMQGDTGSEVTALETSIEIWSQGARTTLGPGSTLRVDAAGAGDILPASRWRAAWSTGMLVVRDEPLAAVIDALRPYRRGWIRLAPPAARLRVVGTFPLDDTDATLEALAQTLPVTLRRHGGWLVTLEARTA